MAKTAEVIEAMRVMAGTPAEMAATLNLEASDASFRRAVVQLVKEGVLIPEGSTRDRSYRNANHSFDDLDQALLDAVPCTAREFSDAGHKLGLYGTVLGRRKQALGILTYKALDGRWYCRLTKEGAERAVAKNGSVRQARICPKCNQRQFSDPKWVCPEHGVAVDQVDMPTSSLTARRPTGDQFAHMAAAAGKGGRIIGSGKQKAPE